MIQSKIIQEVKDTRIYTIMVDEVTSGNTELMPVCILFVDKELTIKEEFLEVVALKHITALHIANKIKDVLGRLGLNIRDCRGQSSTSSNRVGVQALIRQDAPTVVYIPL